MAAPIAAASAGHSLASASAAFLSSRLDVWALENEGEDDLGVGHGRGSPGNGDTDRDKPGSQRGRPETKTTRGTARGGQDEGGVGQGGQALKSGAIPDGAYPNPVSGERSTAGWPSRYRHARLGWIDCSGRLLTHRTPRARIGVKRWLVGSCGPCEAAAVGAFLRRLWRIRCP